ncbi:MAG TPA: hypothetical protein VGC15_13095 [Acetobacteraceae bacterium]
MPTSPSGFRDPGPRPVQGRFVLDVYRGGRLVEHVDESNLVVVNAGVILAGLLGGSIAAPGLTQLGVGTSMIPSDYGNTTLTNPYLRPLNAADYPVLGSVRCAFELDAEEANGMSIGEFGLFSAGGLLFARKYRFFAPIPKDASTSLRGTWTIAF